MNLKKYKKIICGLESNKINGAFPEDNLIGFHYDNLPDDDTLCFLGTEIVTYSLINKIDASDKYFYIIEVRNPNYFRVRYNPLRSINPIVLKDVRENMAKIVINYSLEGDLTRDDLLQLDRWINELDLNPTNFYLLIGNSLATTLRVSYNIITVAVWDSLFSNDVINLEYKPKGNDLYLCLNRIAREHRIMMLYKLYDYQLLDKGLVSYTLGPNNFLCSDRWPKLSKLNDKLQNTSRILDYTHDKILADKITRELYERTFVSVITETLIDPEYLMPTEKTWKTIYMGHPFMILGSPGILKELKSMGYKTFDKWFDESYDDELSLDKRSEIIIKNLKKYMTYSVDELIKVRQEMNEVTEFNQQLFRKTFIKKYMVGSTFYNRKPISDFLLNLLKNW